jgi:outer membrane protein OmpA-like peptidoglycan-associated protein
MTPKVYTGNDTAGTTDFRTNAFFTRLSFSNDLKFTFKKSRFLIVSPWIQSTNYLHQRQANAMLYKLALDYKTPIFKKVDLNIGLTLEKNRKLTIDILTDDGANAYDYFLYAPNAVLTYKVNPNLKFEFSNSIGNKNYVPMPSGQDFSHWYHTHFVSGIFRFKSKNYLQLDLKYHKQFFDVLKMEVNNNEPIQWRYLTIYGSYKYKINKDKYVTAFSQFYKKNDFNKADFTFWQWSNGISGEWKIKKVGLTSSLNYIRRNYLTRMAYIASNSNYDSTLLTYTYFNANLSVKYYIKNNIELFAGVFAEKRLTNSTRQDKKYRRPYETYTISVGLVYNLQLESKKAKKAVPEKNPIDELNLNSTDSEEEQLNDVISPIPDNEPETEPVIEPIKDDVVTIEPQNENKTKDDITFDFSDEMFRNIELETGKNDLSEESIQQLIDLSKALKDHPEAKLQIDAYTDNVGTDQANLVLSKKRADRVAQLLIQNGISANQLIVKNHGESNPIGDNSTEEGRKLNRRVELTLVN